MPNRLKIAFSCLLAFFLFCLPVTSSAQESPSGLTIYPVRVNLTNGERIASVNIMNAGDRAQIMRVQVMRWTQVQGKDHYASADDDILVVPPILSVPPKESRVIRLGLRGLLSGTRERAYRLFLTQISQEAFTRRNGVQINFRFGVPVFAQAQDASKQGRADAGLAWSAALDSRRRKILLHVADQGDTHVVLQGIRIYADASKTKMLGEQQFSDYLLAGYDRTFKFPGGKGGMILPTVVVEGIGANGPFDAVVPVALTAQMTHP